MKLLDSSIGWQSDGRIQKSHLWLCCSPVLFRTIDYGLTLYAQPVGYWQGHYALAREGSSILLWCLRFHPLAFVGAGIALNLFFSLLILSWPITPARFIAAVVTFAHIYGVATWIVPSGALGCTACIALLYFCWSLIDTTWRKQQQADQQGLAQAANLP